MSKAPKCQEPGCGLLMIYKAPFPQGRGISGRFVCPRKGEVVALRDALEAENYNRITRRWPAQQKTTHVLSDTFATAQRARAQIEREALESAAGRMIELYNIAHACFADETIRAAILGEKEKG